MFDELFGHLNPAVTATLAGLIVGFFTKFMSKTLDRRKEKLEEHMLLRKELREELDSVKNELHQLQTELDEWRQKYYAQVELTNELKMDILRLTDELNEYKRISGVFPAQDTRENNGWTSPEDYIK